jgi:hypothetical protein
MSQHLWTPAKNNLKTKSQFSLLPFAAFQLLFIKFFVVDGILWIE